MSKKDQGSSVPEAAKPSSDVPLVAATKKTTSRKKKEDSSTTGRQKVGKTGSTFLPWLSLLLAVAATGVAGYSGWRAWLLERNLPVIVSGLESEQRSELARLQEQFDPLRDQLDQQRENQQQLEDSTKQLSRLVAGMTSEEQDSLKMAEVAYLLRLANQHLQMSHDARTARALLEGADKQLLEFDRYYLYPVREALAQDIAAIRQLPQFDQEGTYLQLDALAKTLDTLPLFEKLKISPALPTSSLDEAVKPPTTTETPQTAGGNSAWLNSVKHFFVTVWNSFVSLYRYTPDREEPIVPLLTSEEESLIRQNLRLMLEQAKLSVVTREQALYASSLKSASEWINHYFALSGQQTAAVLSELEELSAVTVKPVTTDISRALDLLEDIRSKQGQTTGGSDGQQEVSEL